MFGVPSRCGGEHSLEYVGLLLEYLPGVRLGTAAQSILGFEHVVAASGCLNGSYFDQVMRRCPKFSVRRVIHRRPSQP